MPPSLPSAETPPGSCANTLSTSKPWSPTSGAPCAPRRSPTSPAVVVEASPVARPAAVRVAHADERSRRPVGPTLLSTNLSGLEAALREHAFNDDDQPSHCWDGPSTPLACV